MSAALVPELSVVSLSASLAFYCDLIGFSVRYSRAEEGFAYIALGHAELMLDQSGVGRDWVTAPADYPRGRGVNFQIEIDTLTPILDRLCVAGVELFQPVEQKTYRVADGNVTQKQFCIQDPDGYLLRLFESV